MLTLTNLQFAQAGVYAVLVTNNYGSILSSNATLTVNPAVPPMINSQPTNQTTFAGSNATFSVTASGTAPLSYQWNFNGTNLTDGGNISGSTTINLTITNVLLSQSGSYAVLVTNYGGSILSSNATLAVLTIPPTITQQPTNQTTFAGGTATFIAAAAGTAPLSYQWNFNTTNIVGATNATLTLTNVQLSQAGKYALQVTNIAGTAFSSNAMLTVNLCRRCRSSRHSTRNPAVGTVVNIYGLNFDPTPGNNVVYFGAVQAVVTGASATNLTVTVPARATFAPSRDGQRADGLRQPAVHTHLPRQRPDQHFQFCFKPESGTRQWSLPSCNCRSRRRRQAGLGRG